MGNITICKSNTSSATEEVLLTLPEANDTVFECMATTRKYSAYGEGRLIQQLKTGNKYILKTFLANNATKRNKYLNELKLRRDMNSPSLIKLISFTPHSFNEFCTTFYSVKAAYEFMEVTLLDELNYLSDKLASNQNNSDEFYFPLKKILNMMQGVLEGLIALKNEGIAHGDIRPSNIFVGKKGEHKLTDVQFLTGVNAITKVVMGFRDCCYLSPELFSQFRQLSPKSKFDLEKGDIFSLGLMSLQLALNFDPVKLYNYETFNFNKKLLADTVDSLKSKGPRGDSLHNLLKAFLELKEDDRIDFERALTEVKELNHRESSSIVVMNFEETKSGLHKDNFNLSTLNETITPRCPFSEFEVKLSMPGPEELQNEITEASNRAEEGNSAEQAVESGQIALGKTSKLEESQVPIPPLEIRTPSRLPASRGLISPKNEKDGIKENFAFGLTWSPALVENGLKEVQEETEEVTKNEELNLKENKSSDKNYNRKNSKKSLESSKSTSSLNKQSRTNLRKGLEVPDKKKVQKGAHHKEYNSHRIERGSFSKTGEENNLKGFVNLLNSKIESALIVSKNTQIKYWSEKEKTHQTGPPANSGSKHQKMTTESKKISDKIVSPKAASLSMTSPPARANIIKKPKKPFAAI